MKKSSSKDFTDYHPYIKDAILNHGMTRDGWKTSKIIRTETGVKVKIYEKQI